MKTLSLFLLLTTVFPTSFKFDKSGLTDFIVIETPKFEKQDLYSKSVKWVKTTDGINITENIQNDMIRIQGESDNTYCIGANCYPVTYAVDISFKEGKYKFDPVFMKYKLEGITNIITVLSVHPANTPGLPRQKTVHISVVEKKRQYRL